MVNNGWAEKRVSLCSTWTETVHIYHTYYASATKMAENLPIPLNPLTRVSEADLSIFEFGHIQYCKSRVDRKTVASQMVVFPNT